jgi:hypothetical protein
MKPHGREDRMDDERYEKKQDEESAQHEARCKRCGTCCGAGGSDPCSNLERCEDGKYKCRIYENRIGPQYTASGHIFYCVPIRQAIEAGLPTTECGYSRMKFNEEEK